MDNPLMNSNRYFIVIYKENEWVNLKKGVYMYGMMSHMYNSKSNESVK